MKTKIREWLQRIRWKLGPEYRYTQEGRAVRERWLKESMQPTDKWIDERGEER